MPFQKGHSYGRPKGSVGKATAIVKEALLYAFDKNGGNAAFAKWAKKEPTEYYKLLVKLLPKELEISGADGGPIKAQVEVVFAKPESENKG